MIDATKLRQIFYTLNDRLYYDSRFNAELNKGDTLLRLISCVEDNMQNGKINYQEAVDDFNALGAAITVKRVSDKSQFPLLESGAAK